MPKLDVVAILKLQHKEVSGTVQRLDEAIRVLEGLGGKGPRRHSGISPAGRKADCSGAARTMGQAEASEEKIAAA